MQQRLSNTSGKTEGIDIYDKLDTLKVWRPLVVSYKFYMLSVLTIASNNILPVEVGQE